MSVLYRVSSMPGSVKRTSPFFVSKNRSRPMTLLPMISRSRLTRALLSVESTFIVRDDPSRYELILSIPYP